MSSKQLILIGTKFFTLIGVAVFCYAVIWISPITVISRTLSLEGSVYFLQFERHFWQYSIAFIAVVILSRGHLWSYGINSQNLKISMVWLVWMYGFTVVMTMSGIAIGKEMLPAGAAALVPGTSESVIASMVYWMSSPVANQILFFGFVQTVLMKQWGDSFSLLGFPLSLVVASIFFAVGATSSHFSADPAFLIPTFILGLFCGVVYWKTKSLITPMLGHAFFFGFPVFIHLLRSGSAQ
ncbi:MAG: CPBP family intramembrane glutamic endopeptidase [Bacteriovoracaceae bacterium]|nr:CPBP family intramembrane metalloprotease [Bacteroidota bacterium]